MIGQIIFILISVLTLGYAYKQFLGIKHKIFLGQDEKLDLDKTKSLKNMFLVAFGQKKMFKRIVPAVLHLFIYVAFLLTQIELIEILIDGIFGQHRFLSPFLGGFYGIIINFIEILSVLAFIATIAFLSRRNLLKIPRFHMPEMKGWPTLDANLILFLELLLLLGIFSMNTADFILQSRAVGQYHPTPGFLISSHLGFILDGFSNHALILIERMGWWLHILVVFIFINYLPKSKHLHIFLAFFNTYFAPQKPKGEMENMPEIMNEVKGMMGLSESGEDDFDPNAPIPEFGSNDVTNLSWKNVLDAYTCTECGRCSSMCPANITGKKLSPRKIMMDVRDRAEDIYAKLESKDRSYIKEEFKNDDSVTLTKDSFDDGLSLFDSITPEEIHACTTCNACVEACPVMISPLDIIIKMRRYEVLTLSQGPPDLLNMYNAIENSGAVWQMPEERDDWIKQLED